MKCLVRKPKCGQDVGIERAIEEMRTEPNVGKQMRDNATAAR